MDAVSRLASPRWIVLIGSALALAGCGGDGDQSGPGAVESVTPTTSEAVAQADTAPMPETPTEMETQNPTEPESHTEPETGTEPEIGTGPETGTVKWFSAEKGYGSIAPDDGGPDVFVHFSAITSVGIAGETFTSLDEGARVEFQTEEGPDGLQAANVRLISSE